MDGTVVLGIVVVVAVTVICVVGMRSDKVTGAQIVPLLTLMLGLAGGGAAGAVVADSASTDAANDAVSKVRPEVRDVQAEVKAIQRDVQLLQDGN